MSLSYCIIVSVGNDCNRFKRLYSGDLSDIAKCLLDESEEALNACRDGMTLKQCEEWYCCDFDSYRKLKRRKKNFPEELIRNYYFQMSDMYVSVSEMARSPEEIEKMINDFNKENEE